MNQVHRLGLGIAGIAAVITVAGALVVDGYVTASKDVAQATVTQQDPATAPAIEPTIDATDSATPNLDPLTIYVKPALVTPVPTVTRVTKPAPVARPAQAQVKPVPVQVTPAPVPVQVTPAPVATPPIIHVVVTPPPGGHDNGGTDD
jgi:hypothetical protein